MSRLTLEIGGQHVRRRWSLRAGLAAEQGVMDGGRDAHSGRGAGLV